MLENRFASLFDLRKKRKGIILMLMVILTLGTMGLCISCTQNADSETEDSIVYKNETLGFSLEFPKDWKDKYIIEESENSIAVFSKKVYEKDGGGLLFTIERVIGEVIMEEDMQQAPVGQKIVLQGNGYTYFTRMPSDVQYPLNDEELSSEYKAMSEQISDMSHRISILGDQKPKATNEGFKVVGSSFFTVEIPKDWELKMLEESAPRWNIYAGDKDVGGIDLIPYKSEGLSVENADINIMREYLFEDVIFREVRITLNMDDADQGTMEKIKNSFEFANGPFNVVDLQYNVEQYLSGGGKKIFGTIEDFDIENGKSVAVHINVMRFLTDNPDDEYPNGFRIEDLNQIETYSLDFGVSVAPLVAPNYNTYGIYEMPTLDESFIKNYENYKNAFYDFIIGSDGQLKIVLGRYVP